MREKISKWAVMLPALLLLLVGFAPLAAQQPGGGEEEEEESGKEYSDVITEDAVTREGLFKTHRIGDDLFFEIPEGALDREMLLIARPVENSAASGFFGGGPSRIVQWERVGERVVLREKEYAVVADSASAIWGQVSGMRKGPIIMAFDVETFGPDSAAVVDVTELYTSSVDQMGSVDGLQRDKSWIEHVAPFERNIEVEATQSGRTSGGRSVFRGRRCPCSRRPSSGRTSRWR